MPTKEAEPKLTTFDSDCYNIYDFDRVSMYIKEKGSIKENPEFKTKGDTTDVFEIGIDSWKLELDHYQDYLHIIVMDQSEEDPLPKYFISNKEGKIDNSFYYSRFETDEDLKLMSTNWCQLISSIRRISSK